MRKTVVVAMGAFLAVSVLAGCAFGRSSSSDEGEPPIGQLLSVTDLRTFVLPLDPYRQLPGRRQSTIEQARFLLFKWCLARFGFDYQIPPLPDPAAWKGMERRYGITNAEKAASWGYHPVAKPDDKAKYWEPTGDMLAVLTGDGPSSYGGQQVPEGGCAGEARSKLAGGATISPNEGHGLGDALSARSLDRTYEDSRVVKAIDDWRACMKRAGYDYANPLKANDDARWWADDVVASPEEINTAVADVRCKKETNFVNVIVTVETAYQQRALEHNAEALAAIKAGFEAQERKAAAIIAGQQ